MGTDFIERTKRSFEKHLDNKRAKLATADLFSVEPTDVCQTFSAVVEGTAKICVGEALAAEVSSNRIVLRRELQVVAVVTDPPVPVLQAIQDSCGIATAIVQEVHIFAGVIEVTLC